MKGKQYYFKINNEKVEISKIVYEEYRKLVNHQIYDQKKYRKHVTSLSNDIERIASVKIEDSIINDILIEKLKRILDNLSEAEKILVQELFFEQKSERDLAKEYHLTQGAIHARKVALLRKLKKLLKM